MILKVNDTEKFNISMTLHIDDKAKDNDLWLLI